MPRLPEQPRSASTACAVDARQADGPVAGTSGGLLVVTLDDERATDPDLVGAKAAALARARAGGVHTLPGQVITTEVSSLHDAGTAVEGLPRLAEVFHAVSADAGGGAVIVRSSSVGEDLAGSSMAGQFESVAGVTDPEGFLEAVRTVLDSRGRASAEGQPIAMLVQPMVEPALSGVYFGVDPVTGRSDRRLVNAVAGQPEALVSGDSNASRYLLQPDASIVEAHINGDVEVSGRMLRKLVSVGDDLEATFDGPQDVEWAVVDDQLVVLQSRPVTTEITGVPTGPLMGRGPVAETFPDPLAPLEVDLWVPPLRDGLREALLISGTVPERRLGDRELVTVVSGWVALDLAATGEVDDPDLDQPVIGRVRRLGSAWRLGRLRSALPLVADELCEHVDADLSSVPALEGLTERQLVGMLARVRDGLYSLHAHEILMGLVTDPSGSRFTGASVALRVLGKARRDGHGEQDMIGRFPVILAVVPPRIPPAPELPAGMSSVDDSSEYIDIGTQVHREALRLRIRWLQELSARAGGEIGRRLSNCGALLATEHVRHLTLEELSAVVDGRAETLPGLLEAAHVAGSEGQPALPARFRLSDRGLPVPVRQSEESAGGTGAGGGVAEGIVTHDEENPPGGSVLVVENLRPGLGPLLAGLAGIVSETGSVLSHLAILARESSVATVVGHTGARAELSEGATVRVDGNTGKVTIVDEGSTERAQVERAEIEPEQEGS